MSEKSSNKINKGLNPPKFITGIQANLNREIPVLSRKLCIKCGECGKNICDMEAIQFKPREFPFFNLNKCNYCLKCIEICTYKAISKGKSGIKGLFLKMDKNE
jgi:MinD superfamily P-loop ATPase